MINVTKPVLPPFEEFVDEIKDIWTNNWLTNDGPKHTVFLEQIKKYLKITNAQLYTNGHLALEIALKSLKLQGEIITTPFTFVSTTHAILNNGLTPVFCDIEPETYTIDVNKIEELITDKTCAIMPVHVYGNVCNIEEIKKIADKYNLKVIYDAAHAFGVNYKDKGIGLYGDISMFSLHATKVFHSIEGGLLSYNDKNLTFDLIALRNFGINGFNEITLSSINAKMNEFQASMGICNLKHIDEYINKRKECVKTYRERLKGIEGIILCKPNKFATENYAYMPVQFIKKDFGYSRDEVCDILNRNEIFPRKYFYPLISNMPLFKEFDNKQNLSIANKIAENIVTLPLYADLTTDEIHHICDIILNVHK